MDALGERRGLEGERIMTKVPRKRTPECNSSARLSQLRNGPVGVGGEIYSIMIETHKHCRAMEAFSRQRLPLELERTHSHRQAGSAICRTAAAAGRHLSQTLSHSAKRAFLSGTQEKALVLQRKLPKPGCACV